MQTDTDCCVHVCTHNDALEDNTDVSTPVPIKKWCLESFIKVFCPVFKLELMLNVSGKPSCKIKIKKDVGPCYLVLRGINYILRGNN